MIPVSVIVTLTCLVVGLGCQSFALSTCTFLKGQVIALSSAPLQSSPSSFTRGDVSVGIFRFKLGGNQFYSPFYTAGECLSYHRLRDDTITWHVRVAQVSGVLAMACAVVLIILVFVTTCSRETTTTRRGEHSHRTYYAAITALLLHISCAAIWLVRRNDICPTLTGGCTWGTGAKLHVTAQIMYMLATALYNYYVNSMIHPALAVSLQKDQERGIDEPGTQDMECLVHPVLGISVLEDQEIAIDGYSSQDMECPSSVTAILQAEGNKGTNKEEYYDYGDESHDYDCERDQTWSTSSSSVDQYLLEALSPAAHIVMQELQDDDDQDQDVSSIKENEQEAIVVFPHPHQDDEEDTKLNTPPVQEITQELQHEENKDEREKEKQNKEEEDGKDDDQDVSSIKETEQETRFGLLNPNNDDKEDTIAKANVEQTWQGHTTNVLDSDKEKEDHETTALPVEGQVKLKMHQTIQQAVQEEGVFFGSLAETSDLVLRQQQELAQKEAALTDLRKRMQIKEYEYRKSLSEASVASASHARQIERLQQVLRQSKGKSSTKLTTFAVDTDADVQDLRQSIKVMQQEYQSALSQANTRAAKQAVEIESLRKSLQEKGKEIPQQLGD